MKHRKLSNITVSAIGLGCMGLSEFYGETDEAQSIKTIHAAIEQGINFFDTADMYGFGHNEKLLAKALQGKRDQVVIATKFGILRDPNDPMFRGVCGHPAYVKKSVETSLKNLGAEYIDLYYQHRVDPAVPIEETVGAMSELVAQGKVRYLGLSEASAATIRRANKIHPIAAVQSEYSMMTRDVEANDVLATTKKLGIAFVAYSPLSRALLTNEFSMQTIDKNDFRQYLPRFTGEHYDNNQRLVQALQEMAAAKHCTVAQLSLAWLLAQDDSIIPIPGTKREKYLQENSAALEMHLTPQELLHLKDLLDRYQPSGERYPAEIIKYHNLNG